MPRPTPPGGLRTWIAVVVAAAAVMTVVDATLLQLKRAYFTGGFLAEDYLRTPIEMAAFLLTSWVGDAAVIGVVAAVVLAVAPALKLTRPIALLLAGVIPLLLFGLADVVSYKLIAHLGDAFDLSLMFDLTGGSPAEVLAVSVKQLALPAAVVLGLLVTLAFVIRRVNRRAAAAGAPPARFGSGRLMRAALLLLTAGAVVTTSARVLSAELDNGLKRKPTTDLLGTIADAVSDIDRDGFGVLLTPTDPAPTDARIYPYAVDLPGNGLDENGVAGDLPAGYPEYAERKQASDAWPRRPDVVLVVLESVRADAVGARQADKPVTPVLDELSARGLHVDAAFSHNGYTAQSRYHLMTGSVASLRGGTSLIDDVKAQGYEVGYFSGQDDSFGGKDTSVGADRADRMFDARQAKQERYSTFSTQGSLAIPASSVLTRVRTFLDGRRAERPLFLYVNFHDTHYPYYHQGMPLVFAAEPLRESAISPSRRDQLHVTYLNAVSYVDRAVGDVLTHVKQTTGRTPAVIVVGDHGESLFDDTFLGHGYALNDTQTRIPLIAAGIPLAVSSPFGQSDLRDAVVRALSRPDQAEVPSAKPVEEKRVFQYLGRLDRPRQIGFIGSSGRITFDFRSRRVCFGQACIAEARLDESQRSRFLELVRHWEAMVVARAHAGLRN